MSIESDLAKAVIDTVKSSPQYQKVRWAAIIFVLLFIIVSCAAGYLALQYYFHPAQSVTGESQRQAEALEGIELAAKNAHINMLQSQLEEAAKQIASLNNRPPDTVIRTVPVEVVKTVESEREKRGADFAIVTDPKQLDKQVDLNQVQNLPADMPITLNQYNVFAYKKKLHQVEFTPDWSGTIRGKWKLDEMGYGETRKISNDGKYAGWKIGYNFKHEEAKMAITYMF